MFKQWLIFLVLLYLVVLWVYVTKTSNKVDEILSKLDTISDDVNKTVTLECNP